MTTRLDTLKAMQQLIGDLIAAEGGAEGAAPVPQAPPGHAYLPVTGHILPLPSEADVSLWGYLLRVNLAAGGNAMTPTMRNANLASAWAGDTVTAQKRDRWPEAVDRVLNWEAYATPEEIARRRAEQEAAAAAPFISTPRPRPPAPPAVGSE